jgi:alginate O-acetyltransferase complex protein AlgF
MYRLVSRKFDMKTTASATAPLRRRVLAAAACWALGGVALAQQTALYDPQPPADSAYVRVIVLGAGHPADILLGDKIRIKGLPSVQPSDYMVLPAGRHVLSVRAGGKIAPATVEAAPGRSMTVLIPAGGGTPIMLEDKTNTNKLKAMLSFYNLDAKAGAVDVLTADGSTKVFAGVGAHASAGLAVNPISADLIVAKAGEKAPLARTALKLDQGGAYSIVFAPGEAGKPATAVVYANKVERYTGK